MRLHSSAAACRSAPAASSWLHFRGPIAVACSPCHLLPYLTVVLLQAYAVGFFAIPLVRWLRNKARNAKIEAQNADRRQARLVFAMIFQY